MLIGIDAGGTKNELVLCDKQGHVINRLLSKGTNASDIGVENAVHMIASQIRELTNDFAQSVEALFLGMSGGGAPQTRDRVHQALLDELPQIARIGNDSDALNGLYAGIGPGDGMGVIAGTGTSAFVRKSGALKQVGGWGYLVDDGGSGYWIGRAVLCAAFRHRDGRGPATMLTDLVCRQLGFDVLNAIPTIYQGGKSTVASFAPLAFEGADAGDEVALQIVDSACHELALLISTCATHLSAAPYRAVISGSLWKAPRLMAGVKARLSDDYELIIADLPPVYGAALAAAELAGLPCDKAFHDHFAETYAK